MKFDGDKFLEKNGKSLGKNIKIYVGFIMFMIVLVFGFVGWNFISMRSDVDERFSLETFSSRERFKLDLLMEKLEKLETQTAQMVNHQTQMIKALEHKVRELSFRIGQDVFMESENKK